MALTREVLLAREGLGTEWRKPPWRRAYRGARLASRSLHKGAEAWTGRYARLAVG